MYVARSCDRKNHKMKLALNTLSGVHYKHTTRFQNDVRRHQLVQDILDFNEAGFMSDFVFANKKLKHGSFTRISYRHSLSIDTARRNFNLAFRTERMKLLNAGYPLPENQTGIWSRV